MKALLALFNSNLVSTLAGAVIGYVAARATSRSERLARIRSLARGLSAESKRIRAALDTIEILGPIRQLPRVHHWLVPLVTQAGEISADLVLCFLNLEDELGKTELALSDAGGHQLELISLEKEDGRWREWQKHGKQIPGALSPALTEVPQAELAKSRDRAEASTRVYAVAKGQVIDQLDAIDRLLLPHLKG